MLFSLCVPRGHAKIGANNAPPPPKKEKGPDAAGKAPAGLRKDREIKKNKKK